MVVEVYFYFFVMWPSLYQSLPFVMSRRHKKLVFVLSVFVLFLLSPLPLLLFTLSSSSLSPSVLSCQERGSPCRKGGQGDLLSGCLGVCAYWTQIAKDGNRYVS